MSQQACRQTQNSSERWPPHQKNILFGPPRLSSPAPCKHLHAVGKTIADKCLQPGLTARPLSPGFQEAQAQAPAPSRHILSPAAPTLLLSSPCWIQFPTYFPKFRQILAPLLIHWRCCSLQQCMSAFPLPSCGRAQPLSMKSEKQGPAMQFQGDKDDLVC